MALDPEKKEFGAWWVWIAVLLVGTLTVFASLNALGVVGRTVVERTVFENSYQRSEGLKSEIAMCKAQIAELESQLQNPSLNAGTKADINAQLAAIRVQLRTARDKQGN